MISSKRKQRRLAAKLQRQSVAASALRRQAMAASALRRQAMKTKATRQQVAVVAVVARAAAAGVTAAAAWLHLLTRMSATALRVGALSAHARPRSNSPSARTDHGCGIRFDLTVVGSDVLKFKLREVMIDQVEGVALAIAQEAFADRNSVVSKQRPVPTISVVSNYKSAFKKPVFLISRGAWCALEC